MQSGSALVTGASGGLGVALANNLARRGYPLVLTARSRPALKDVACRIRDTHGVAIIVQPADLSRPEGATELIAALDAQEVRPSILVNNAGFGLNERFQEHSSERLEAMLHLNVLALTGLTHAYAQRMKSHEGGHILLVASLAAYMPAPLMAAYGASKAYVLSLGEALHVELAPEVGVTVLSPGYMETGFDDASGFQPNAATKSTALPHRPSRGSDWMPCSPAKPRSWRAMRTRSRPCWDAFSPKPSWRGSSTSLLASGTTKDRVSEPLAAANQYAQAGRNIWKSCSSVTSE